MKSHYHTRYPYYPILQQPSGQCLGPRRSHCRNMSGTDSICTSWNTIERVLNCLRVFFMIFKEFPRDSIWFQSFQIDFNHKTFFQSKLLTVLTVDTCEKIRNTGVDWNTVDSMWNHVDSGWNRVDSRKTLWVTHAVPSSLDSQTKKWTKRWQKLIITYWKIQSYIRPPANASYVCEALKWFKNHMVIINL